MVVPVASTVAVGNAGGVMSGAERLIVGEIAPALVACCAVSVSPFACAGDSAAV